MAGLAIFKDVLRVSASGPKHKKYGTSKLCIYGPVGWGIKGPNGWARSVPLGSWSLQITPGGHWGRPWARTQQIPGPKGTKSLL